MEETDVEVPKVITLGGRVFKVIDFDARTVAQDHYLMKWIRATTVDKCIPHSLEGEESTEAYLLRVQQCLIDSGLMPELLGGYLVPEGMTDAQWVPATGKQTAKFIAGLNTQEDREMVIYLSMQVAFGFFRQGLNFLKRFQNFSPTGEMNEARSGVTQH